MIAIKKGDNTLFKVAKATENGNFFVASDEKSLNGALYSPHDLEIYFDESEIQKRIEVAKKKAVFEHADKSLNDMYLADKQAAIESAVAEHLATMQETENHLRNKVTKLEATDHELRACIEKLQLKCDRLEEENEVLIESIAELEAQIEARDEEWKHVEISARLAEAIQHLRKHGWCNESILFNCFENPDKHEFSPYIDLYHVKYIYECLQGRDDIGFENAKAVTNALYYSYSIKPDPLRTRIAAILGNDHEQLDAVVAAVREGEAE